MSDDFQDEIAFLGIEASPSFVRQGNGVAESFIRTLKENLLWVQRFETIENLRLALLKFTNRYNTQWSPVMAAEHPLRSGATSRASLTWPHERCSRLSHNRGAVYSWQKPHDEATLNRSIGCPFTSGKLP